VNANGLWQRLQQRKLVQWALAYVAAAFALLQGIDIVAAKFGWPDSIERMLIVALCVGFFVTLLLAWYHGERGVQRVSGTELLLLALLLAIGGGLLWKFSANATAPVAAATSAPASRPEAGASAANPIAIDAKSIAVLPFENLSGDKDNEYFAGGMQDMILTKLAAIGDLKVISRTSTEKYASHPDNLKTIAQQLGVASILEGSVQRSGNSVLINVQLIDAASDRHLWADAYPRTLDNIFGVEGEVAQKVADALQAKLTSAETASVAAMATRNPAAYEVFLKAEYELDQARRSQQDADFFTAASDFRRAIELDPQFALAHAKLAYCELNRHWFGTRLTPTEFVEVKHSIDLALALAPDLPQAHLSLGFYYYWGFRRYDDAVVEFKRALLLAPNNLEAISGLAYIARRKGQLAQTLEYFEHAVQLSPRDTDLRCEYGWTYLLMRRYPEAERQLRLSLAISPDYANSIDALRHVLLFGFGDVAGVRKIAGRLPGWRIAAANSLAGDILYLVNQRVFFEVYDRRFADALRAWDGAPTDTEEEQRTGKVARVVIRILSGDAQSARADCASLEPQLDAELAKKPDSLGLLQQSSWVEVCLGHNQEAIAAAQKAADILPISKDAFFGTYQLSGLAQIAAWAGATDLAFKTIRELLAMPAGTVMSVTRLRLDPVWDPLRKDPRFQALLAGDDSKSGTSR
jgi:TolB-like protein/Tfp pilus assembly protein PilF